MFIPVCNKKEVVTLITRSVYEVVLYNRVYGVENEEKANEYASTENTEKNTNTHAIFILHHTQLYRTEILKVYTKICPLH